MNQIKRPAEDVIDQLVREHVERQLESSDPSRLIERIGATTRRRAWQAVPRLPAPVPSDLQPAWSWRPTLSWVAMTVLAAAIAFAGGRYVGPRAASAAGLLRNVQAMHHQPVDHCYRVQFAPDPRFWDGRNRLEGPSSSILWTRGDRFWSACTIGDWQLKLGREADGTIWVSPSPSRGLRFQNDPARLPKEVSLICAVNSMSVPQLVKEVLADFDLRVDAATEQAADAKTLIWASLKAGRSHHLLSDALLEIDAESNVLTRLVLWTVRDGQPRGTVTFTLLESTTHGDDRYRLQSHLDPDAEIEVQTLAGLAGDVDRSESPKR